MHYWNFNSTKDKIIHLLCAAYVSGLYGRTIVECIREFGEKETEEAVHEFKENFKENLKKIN
nr:MAG TPA: Tethering Ubl4a to BAGS domain [Caudoviricetes sp.]